MLNKMEVIILPPKSNLLQFYLEDTQKFTTENKMKINGKETKVMDLQQV